MTDMMSIIGDEQKIIYIWVKKKKIQSFIVAVVLIKIIFMVQNIWFFGKYKIEESSIVINNNHVDDGCCYVLFIG